MSPACWTSYDGNKGIQPESYKRSSYAGYTDTLPSNLKLLFLNPSVFMV